VCSCRYLDFHNIIKFKRVNDLKLSIIVLLVIGTAFMVASCDHEPQRVMQYRKISAEEAFQMMQEENIYILLDVRTTEEFNERHIEGAVLIPDNEISDRVSEE